MTEINDILNTDEESLCNVESLSLVIAAQYGQQCCLEADTMEVAKIMVQDTFLIAYKMVELCDKFGLRPDFKKSITDPSFSSESKLMYILDAWVSKSKPDEANIGNLATILNEMELHAVQTNLNNTYRPATSVVFKKRCMCATGGSQRTMQNNLNYTHQQVLQIQGQRGPPSVAGNSNFESMDVDGQLCDIFQRTKIKSSRFSDKIKVIMHNVPEENNDEDLVNDIVESAKLPEIEELDVKREKPKAKAWWLGWVPSTLKKDKKENPRPLKVTMKAKKREGFTLNKKRIIEELQQTVICKTFKLKVTDDDNFQDT